MTIRQELKVLLASYRIRMKAVKEVEKQIDKVREKCTHPRIRHELFKDIYQRQGRSHACADCGKSFGCSSDPFPDKIETRTWIEKVVK